MINVVNAAPMVKDLGIQDLSPERIPRTPIPVPQHLPKFYIFAQKGPTTPELLFGAERNEMYGDKTFSAGSAYYNHQTIFANAVNARANACMLQRLIPADAGPKANLTLWLDVLETTVDLYERNTDGSIKTSGLGDPVLNGTTPGFKVKWVVTSASTAQQAQQFGLRTQVAGDQVDTDSTTQSIRYPIFDFVVDSQGSYGNDLGIRMWTPMAALNEVPYKMMAQEKAFPYFISVVERESANVTPTVQTTIYNEQFITVTVKPGVEDPLTTKKLYIGENFVPAYGNTTDPRYAIQRAPFSGFHIYQANVDELLEKFHNAEVPFIDQFSDFTSDEGDFGLFNFVTGVSTQNVPYHSFVFVNDQDTDVVTFSAFTDVMAAGGSDGTMTEDIFNEMVQKEIKRYRDRKDELMDLAYHIEQAFYDSGFNTETKFLLPSFISQRHDTFLFLGTHTFGERMLTASEEQSMSASLRTHVLNYPESAYFGTPATRCMIMGCSGVIRNTTYRVPATYEIAIKFARYMGASSGEWNGEYKPDGDPGHLVEELTDLNMVWVPEDVRNRFWDVGLNWIGRFDREAFFIPAYKTVYADDTSVLTSAITVFALCTMNKIGHAAWRSYVGVSYLSDLQLCERVNNFVRDRSRNKFDDRFIIVPSAVVTDLDEARGFSWTLPIKVGAFGMKTLQTLYVQADRAARLQEGA